MYQAKDVHGELKYGFDHDDMFITDPTRGECGRFEVDPVTYYGLTEGQVKEIAEMNGEKS
jgi:hypothetical protein